MERIDKAVPCKALRRRARTQTEIWWYFVLASWKQALRIQGNKAVTRACSVCRTYQGCVFIIHGGDHNGTCTSNNTPPPLANLSVLHSQSVLTFLSICFSAIISSPLLLCSNSHSIQCRTCYLTINEVSYVGLLNKYNLTTVNNFLVAIVFTNLRVCSKSSGYCTPILFYEHWVIEHFLF